ncbi:regulator of chromosome condensation (RCC1) protein (macronuclear) [Tetrahymena thermophila SB210]|uniref:Regulator of chromosome condensation (RCC1) protein n=1 Tax=Tetrahymena thermophila (strain SB210) TaxID=312017 RepID=Q23E68_TETTS|nr:regulator of chromosome condensation (RCC1) protein [Tetrahymena thermophila SB210]EAR94885.2 regulator of chromosome condensation (RCC1) protein [Tetrahymena thermophila SB210]|eukprot:XP_001015130.2 regulator of chromosome condensation (RCC1) protein [Tetrahymena thermophila SB210]
MNSAFQGLIKKLALENNEINEQILKSLSQISTTSKQLDERSNNTFTSSGKVLITNPSDASMAIVENQNFFTL